MKISNIYTKGAILGAFFSLSFLVYCFPIILMQSVSCYNLDHAVAGSLKSFFNLTQLASSFFVFFLFMKFGYKKPLVLAFGIMAALCAFIPLVNNVGIVIAYMLYCGLAYTIIKVSCYSMVSVVTDNPSEHASFVNLMEGVHMLGNMAALWIYSLFTAGKGESWIYLFWVIAAVSGALALLYLCVPLSEAKIKVNKPFLELKGFGKLLVTASFGIFLLLLCCYDFLEQGTGSWLATFNNEVLAMPKDVSVQLQSLFVLSMCFGRFLNAGLLRLFAWHKLFVVNFLLAIGLVLFVFASLSQGLAAQATNIFDLPLIAYCLPLLGIFIAPVYPTLVSTMLSTFSKAQQPLLMSLLMISGAVIDTLAVQSVGLLFDYVGGINAFKYNLLGSLSLLIVITLFYARTVNRRVNVNE